VIKVFIGFFLTFAFTGTAYAECSSKASRAWGALTIAAVSSGPTCAKAVVTMIIREKSGEAKWARAHVAAQLLNFSQDPIADSNAMTKALKGWIAGDGFKTSVDALADWPVGKTEYMQGAEFPFRLADNIERATFLKYRSAKLSLFCYIQGIESGNCLTLDKNNEIIELGVQSFPG
jgi:hypothetical protein